MINGTEIDLQLFEELPAGESPKTTLAPDHEFSTREECAGPFIFRTEDGELYAESPRLCRGDPPFVVTSPDS